MRAGAFGKAALLAAVAGCLLSCAPVQRQPVELDQNLATAGVAGPVVIMRVKDLRANRFDLVGMGTDVHKAAMRLVSAKGYEVMSYRTEISPSAGSPTEPVARLQLAIEEATVETGRRGRQYRVRVSGRLTEGVSLLWHDSAEGRSALSGLLVLLSRPSHRYEAAHEAVAGLLETLPSQGAAGPRAESGTSSQRASMVP